MPGTRLRLWSCLWLLVVATACTTAPPQRDDIVCIATWNIWHGGREDGEDVGPQKVIDVLRHAGADVIAMQETYGSGERLARGLGFHFLARGTNVSLLSRHPIVEDVSVFEPFQSVGGIIELPGRRRIAVYSLWLPYDAEIWEPGTRAKFDRDGLLATSGSATRDLTAIRDAVRERLAGAAYAGMPIVLAGDFNSMSHLDYTEVALEQHGIALAWPTSQVLIDAGFRDVYRECHPDIDRKRDRTWTPRFPEQEQDRIDFLYAHGNVRPIAARVIDQHVSGFPSDHAAVVATLQFASPPPPAPLRVASYNIHHGAGMDERVDLERIGRVLRGHHPDLVALQEVDVGVRRSGGANQAIRLAEIVARPRPVGTFALTAIFDPPPFHAAFGKFMDYDGGRYGMALLSRHPIARSWSVPLPVGNEPRIALAAEIRLPDGSRITAVNVHLDWVDDDRSRYAQAEALVAFLRGLQTPWLLLGDCNDTPRSRTLALLEAQARNVDKIDASGNPALGGGRLTWSSVEPQKEIDYVFVGAPVGAAGDWEVVRGVEVHAEAMASDHRPLTATVQWHPGHPADSDGW